MHADFPLLFRICQYPEFDTGHVNSIFSLDILNVAFSDEDMRDMQMMIWALGAFFEHIHNILLPVYGQLCASSSQQFAKLELRCMHRRKTPFLVRRRNTTTLKCFERLGYQQIFGYAQKSPCRPFRGGV